MRHDGRGVPLCTTATLAIRTFRIASTKRLMAEWQKVSGEIGITTDLEALRALYTVLWLDGR